MQTPDQWSPHPDMWSYRTGSGFGPGAIDIAGFGVEAVDGSIGKIDKATYVTGSDYIVVDTGPWIFGKKVLLPAGVVQRVDLDSETVFVNRTKDEIKDAPEFDEMNYRDDAYRSQVGDYYYGGTRGRTSGVR